MRETKGISEKSMELRENFRRELVKEVVKEVRKVAIVLADKFSKNYKVKMRVKEKGIGLIYTIIFIAVLIIAVGVLGPYLFVRETYRQQDVETLEKIKAIRMAILGNPEIISKGLRSNFGYVGDMGGLPPILEYLVLQQNPVPNPFPVNWNQTGWTIHSTGYGYGWRGPYTDSTYTGNYEFQAFRDAWGTKFRYIDNAGNTIINPATVVFPVYIRSAGQDRTFGTSDDINETTRPDICRITEDDVRAYLRGYTYCEDGRTAQRSNINVYWPSLSLTGTVTATSQTFSSTTSGSCPYQPAQTCYYFETPKIPIGIRKAEISTYVNQFVVINGGGTLHDGSTGRMRWNFRGGSCGCIEAILPRVHYRERDGPCSGGARDVFLIPIRNRCAVPVTINSIRIDYSSTPTLYYRHAAIITGSSGYQTGPGWAFGCGGAPSPGGRSEVTYSFNSTVWVFFWGIPIDLGYLSCSSTSATIPAGATRYLVVGNFVTSTGGCGDIRTITFRITFSDGSSFTVPPP